MAAGTLSRSRTRERPAVAGATLAAGALAAIVALAAALRFASFSDVPANPFYDAAVRSMGQSWHNFLYGAFEPGGQVSIDKTPVDLWLQVASVKLLGFSSTALRLPQAIAGVLAVPLLYDLVRRLFGRPAGLVAALALAVLPISVLTARSDTMDSVMMLLDVLAAWLVVRGAERDRVWLFVAGGAVLGLAFEVKLFEALVALPAIGLLALLAGDLRPRRRVAALASGAAAFVAASLAWVTAASLAPGSHPWPIGSTNGSVWNVVFGYNGVDRLQAPATPRAMQIDPPSALRLLNGGPLRYDSLIGTELLAAVIFGALAIVVAVAARRRSRPRIAAAAFLGAWLVLGVALVSHMPRLQPRYLESITPAVAATVGAGIGWLALAAARRRGPALALAAGAAVVAVAGALLVHPPAWATTVALVAAAAAVVAALTPPGARRTGLAATCAAVAALAIPAASALSVVTAHRSDAGLAAPMSAARTQALSAFLLPRQGHAKYEVASTTVAKTGPLIVRDGRPVLMLTSLYGRPLLTPAQLAGMVKRGEVRYVLPGWAACSSGRACAPVLRWAKSHSVDISKAAGVGPRGTLSRFTGAAAPAPR